MANDQMEQAVAYLSKCPVCTVATASVDGDPSASTVYFSNAGLDIYFNTARDSQKVRNIIANPRVAITLQEISAPKTDREIRGVQYNGKAVILSDAEANESPKPVLARHRAFNSLSRGNSVIVKVAPVRVYLIDYSKGFRHREEIRLNS